MRRCLVEAVVTCATVSGAWGGPPRDNGPPPNVILVSIDTLRADHLGCYGYQRATSPNIDALAAGGVRFASAFAQSCWTLPSHMSLLTSQYPHVHAVQDEGVALRDSAITLAEVLSDGGYDTAAFVSWVFVAAQYGFDQGFAQFTELLPPAHLVDASTRWSVKADKVSDAAIAWLTREPGRPFFLFVHYFDPHIDYEPPPPFDTMFDPDYRGPASGSFLWLNQYIKGVQREPKVIDPRDLEHVTALYDGEIRYTDTHVQRLLEAIERAVGLDNCLVALTSDHGEEFNEHGSMEGHQWTLYDEVLRVPLIIRMPGGARAGTVVEPPVQLIDLAATILEVVKVPCPTSFQGRSLMDLILGLPPAAPFPAVYAETERYNLKQCVRGLRYKLIHTYDTIVNRRGIPIVAGYELYDLRADPREQRNIYDEILPVARLLASELRRRECCEVGDAGTTTASPLVRLSDQERERLRALGYVNPPD